MTEIEDENLDIDKISDLWSDYLQHTISPFDVAMMIYFIEAAERITDPSRPVREIDVLAARYPTHRSYPDSNKDRQVEDFQKLRSCLGLIGGDSALMIMEAAAKYEKMKRGKRNGK